MPRLRSSVSRAIEREENRSAAAIADHFFSYLESVDFFGHL
jgi:hypothetical protein